MNPIDGPVEPPEPIDPELFAEFRAEALEGLDAADERVIGEGVANKDGIDHLFRVFHSIKGVAAFLALDDVTELSHATEDLLSPMRENPHRFDAEAADRVLRATATLRRLIEAARIATASGQPLGRDRDVPALVMRLRGGASAASGATDTAPVEPTALAAAAAGTRSVAARQETSVRVDVKRVDRLVDMIGELLVVESMVANDPEIGLGRSERVTGLLAQLGKITRSIQDLGLGLRMVPMAGLFRRMERVVHDLARRSGKDLRLATSGEETEMDRSLVEMLADPIVHLLRNAADHGVESPQDREAQGKPPRSTILLQAAHEGGRIVIRVSDDGRGIDPAKVLARARERRLVPDGAVLDEAAVYDLLFVPGFSTAAAVTDVSGRGVGLDVVRRNVEQIRGRIHVRSVPGQGTTFELVLPLTLAIIEGMTVRCGAEEYILPTLEIVESFRHEPARDITFAGRGRLASLRGTPLPILPLAELLGVSPTEARPGHIVLVVESASGRFGLVVDEIVTQTQIVIKALDTWNGSDLFAGAAIGIRGQVALILNAESIGALACHRAPRPTARGHRPTELEERTA